MAWRMVAVEVAKMASASASQLPIAVPPFAASLLTASLASARVCGDATTMPCWYG
jgi:hypothetical protein